MNHSLVKVCTKLPCHDHTTTTPFIIDWLFINRLFTTVGTLQEVKLRMVSQFIFKTLGAHCIKHSLGLFSRDGSKDHIIHTQGRNEVFVRKNNRDLLFVDQIKSFCMAKMGYRQYITNTQPNLFFYSQRKALGMIANTALLSSCSFPRKSSLHINSTWNLGVV